MSVKTFDKHTILFGWFEGFSRLILTVCKSAFRPSIKEEYDSEVKASAVRQFFFLPFTRECDIGQVTFCKALFPHLGNENDHMPVL